MATLATNQASIYTAFGDKKGLFMAAVQHYTAGPITSESIIDGTATGREAASGLLRAAAVGFTAESTPRGCLLASSAISCSATAQDVKDELAARAQSHRSPTARQDQAQHQGRQLVAGR